MSWIVKYTVVKDNELDIFKDDKNVITSILHLLSAFANHMDSN